MVCEIVLPGIQVVLLVSHLFHHRFTG
jgi:hypothetical protein